MLKEFLKLKKNAFPTANQHIEIIKINVSYRDIRKRVREKENSWVILLANLYISFFSRKNIFIVKVKLSISFSLNNN